ncbi:MAG: isoleucine--tRNA ligase [Chloroflexi bacterium]|nr:isoleucine--tRNA ligase [Chloroflexota bacterium]
MESGQKAKLFKEVDSKVEFPPLEERIIQFWEDEHIFEKSLKIREGDPRYVVYEGPPTANGLPGVHHVLARIFKDIFPRFKTMKGFYVPRRGGWDCHGLPVELEVEKEIGIKDKQAIEAFGVGKFNALCRESVKRYVAQWEEMTKRIGFWVDMRNAYWTMSSDYIESVWWILRRLWDMGLLYKGYKVVPYCPRCGTPLSSHEVAQGYADVEDPSIYVKFELENEPGTFFLVWTTTPWTLPGNVALAVHPDFKYVMIQQDGDRLILAKDLLEQAIIGEYKVIREMDASELAGKKYKQLYPFVKPDKRAHFVISAEFVTASDGTGIVHIAPAFGEDDLRAGEEYGLPVIQPVDLSGRFTLEVDPWAGLLVKEADPKIIADLKGRGVLYRSEKVLHSYPFCWRCDTALIYYARSSWFVGITKVRDQLVENNRRINWYPEYIKEGRFGNWLENAQDWALSRERYWGTPLPIWECGDCKARECIGSFAELSQRAESPLPADFDPHRPYVDEVTLSCSECGGTMARVLDVIDCWFDSGSMPVGQWHYPFENEDEFRVSFPADFICEAVDQTRGWFYSLHGIATLLFDEPAYKNVISLGLVLGENGERMSKSRGNVVDPWSVLNKHGADGLRWYLFTASPPGNARRFSGDLVGEAVRRFLLTLWNTYSFFVIYANIDGFDPRGHRIPTAERPVMDRWIISELNKLVLDVDTLLEDYDVAGAGRALEGFVDELSNWYVRRNRRRFWKSENDVDKASAYLTLYESLTTLAKLLAPFTPFISEEIYGSLVRSLDEGAPESVHLSQFPVADVTLVDEQLSLEMESAIRVVSLGRAVRNKTGLKVRQPLSEVVVKTRDASEWAGLRKLEQVLLEELNVKRLRQIDSAAEIYDFSVRPNLKLLGPKYGKLVPKIQEALQKGDTAALGQQVQSGLPIQIEVEGQPVVLLPEQLLVESRVKDGYSAVEEAGYVVALNTAVTRELELEGVVRDLVRYVQSIRKSAGFNIEDTIMTYYQPDGFLHEAVHEYASYIKGETLSKELIPGSPPPGAYSEKVAIAGQAIEIGVVKVSK